MRRRQRRAALELGAASAQVQEHGEAALRQAKELLGRACPPGWTPHFVMPPWDRTARGCRSCATLSSPRWATVTMTRRDEAERRVLFTFAAVCEACARDQQKMNALADRAFSAVQ